MAWPSQRDAVQSDPSCHSFSRSPGNQRVLATWGEPASPPAAAVEPPAGVEAVARAQRRSGGSDVIAENLSQAPAGALSPILAVTLMLATPRARSNGPAFVVGWVLGTLSVVGVVVLAGSGREYGEGGGGPAT
jgi:hypothetical protein